MAEHMYSKYEQLGNALSPDTAEDIADLFYEIGKQALEKSNYEIAVKWLERSWTILEGQQLGMLSPEAGELKLCVIQGLGKSTNLWGINGNNLSCSAGTHGTKIYRVDEQSLALGRAHGSRLW